MGEVIPFRADDRDAEGKLRPFDLDRLAAEIIALQDELRNIDIQAKVLRSAHASCLKALEWRLQQARQLVERETKR